MATAVPAPPAGFKLEDDEAAQAASVPSPPPGFTLESEPAKSPDEQKFEDQVQKRAIASIPKPKFLSYQPTEVNPLSVTGGG